MTELGAVRLVDRVECEAYDHGQMAAWTESVAALVGAPAAVHWIRRDPW